MNIFTKTDRIADLQRQVAALTKENERLKTACNKFSESEILEGNQLAAFQAREQKLRELLPAFRPEFGAVGSRDVVVAQQQKAFDAVLALPTDDTALQARMKEERENVYDEMFDQGYIDKKEWQELKGE